MFLNNSKHFIEISFSILLITCSHAVFAQNSDQQRVLSFEQQSEILKIRTRPDDKIVSEESLSINGLEDSLLTDQLNAKTDFFVIPSKKSNDDWAKSSCLNLKPLSFNQETSLSKNGRKFNFGDSQIPPSKSFFKNDKPDDPDNKMDEGFRWRSAISQSLMFLAIQHGYAFTQTKTREALKGKFFKDYAKSVKSLHGWADGGRFFTNYIAHPMQGAFTGFIQIQNDPKGLRQRFGTSKDYWQSRLKAFAWTAAWSTQFEIGPISQASIGNVGLKGKQTYVDLVMTPVGGTAMLISEDAIDRFVMKNIERRTNNFYIIIFSRMLLSPTRTIANLFRFKTPWYRDRPRAK